MREKIKEWMKKYKFCIIFILALVVAGVLNTSVYGYGIVQQGILQDTATGTCIVFRTSVKASPDTIEAYNSIVGKDASGQYKRGVWVNQELDVEPTKTTYKAPYLYFTKTPVATYSSSENNTRTYFGEHRQDGNYLKSLACTVMGELAIAQELMMDTFDYTSWLAATQPKFIKLNGINVKANWKSTLIYNDAAENVSLPYIYRDSQGIWYLSTGKGYNATTHVSISDVGTIDDTLHVYKRYAMRCMLVKLSTGDDIYISDVLIPAKAVDALYASGNMINGKKGVYVSNVTNTVGYYNDINVASNPNAWIPNTTVYMDNARKLMAAKGWSKGTLGVDWDTRSYNQPSNGFGNKLL